MKNRHLKEMSNGKELVQTKAEASAEMTEAEAKAYWQWLVQTGKIPPSIPPNPDVIYKHDGWVSFKDFLGV